MKRSMTSLYLAVTNDGTINLTNGDTPEADDQPVLIDPDSIDTLIRWLQEAKPKAQELRRQSQGE